MLSAEDRLLKIEGDIYKKGPNMDFVSVAVPQSLYNEFIIRKRADVDVSLIIAKQAYNFLERTLGDDIIWSEEHAEEVADEEALARREKYGPATKGLYWKSLFLPNGTRVRMTYGGVDHFAEIRHERLMDDDESFSPSQWASHVAGGTNRNAWRDLFVKTPGTVDWELAATARRAGQPGEILTRALADPERMLLTMKQVLPAEKFKEIEASIREIIND